MVEWGVILPRRRGGRGDGAEEDGESFWGSAIVLKVILSKYKEINKKYERTGIYCGRHIGKTRRRVEDAASRGEEEG